MWFASCAVWFVAVAVVLSRRELQGLVYEPAAECAVCFFCDDSGVEFSASVSVPSVAAFQVEGHGVALTASGAVTWMGRAVHGCTPGPGRFLPPAP